MSFRIENGFKVRDLDIFDISTSLRAEMKHVLQRKIVQLYVDTAYEAYDLLTANNGEYENIYMREHGELNPVSSAWSYTKLWFKNFPEEVNAELLFFRIPDTNDLLFTVTGPNEVIRISQSHPDVEHYPVTDDFVKPVDRERFKIWESAVDFDRSLVSQGLNVKVLGEQEKSVTLLVSKKSLQEIGFRRPSVKKRLDALADHILPNDASADRKKVFLERNIHLIDPDVHYADIVAYCK